MMTRSFVFVAFAVALAACGGRTSSRGRGHASGDTGTPTGDGGATDATTTRDGGASRDGGTEDSSIQGCGTNPNGCAPNELLGPAPACACTGSCAFGTAWNARHTACVEVGNDAGVSPDATSNGECFYDSDCLGSNKVCVKPTYEPCSSGQPDCTCADGCDPMAIRPGCVGLECAMNNEQDIHHGVCLPSQGGGRMGDRCTVTVDGSGNYVGDDCDHASSHMCVGVDGNTLVGSCTRFCDPAERGLCESFGPYQCVAIIVFPTLGTCLRPSTGVFDIGRSCSSDSDCDGRVCVSELGSSCSAMCGGLDSCPTGSECLAVVSVGAVCVKSCTGQSSSFCGNLNPSTSCQSIGGSPPVEVCLP